MIPPHLNSKWRNGNKSESQKQILGEPGVASVACVACAAARIGLLTLLTCSSCARFTNIGTRSDFRYSTWAR